MVPATFHQDRAGVGLELQAGPLALAFTVTLGLHGTIEGAGALILLFVLGAAMGCQNVVPLLSPVPDMKTTVMTLTVAALSADLARRAEQKWHLRLASVALLVPRAALGAVPLTGPGAQWVLLAATVCTAGAHAALRSARPARH